jgi:hypothetical protein
VLAAGSPGGASIITTVLRILADRLGLNLGARAVRFRTTVVAGRRFHLLQAARIALRLFQGADGAADTSTRKKT